MQDVSRRAAILLSTFGYIGYVPIVPGTVGSLGGLVLYWLLYAAGPGWFQTALVAAIVTLFASGVWSATIAERHFGGIDPGPVVIDEVAGMLMTLAFVPVGWGAAIVGFFVFRLFDIIKPYPAARLERLPGGLGVMADDAMAAIYANVALRGLLWLAA